MRKQLFLIPHLLFDSDFYALYKKMMESQYLSYTQLKEQQDIQLVELLKYVNENVEYYNQLFKNIDIRNISSVEDLVQIPIIDKTAILAQKELFVSKEIKNIKHYTNNTGGTTGTPFRYHISHIHRLRAATMLYRGWSFGGYNLGDKLFFLGGASLNAGSKYGWLTKIHEFTRNTRFLSSFDMSNENLEKYIDYINKERPLFIRGYPSAIGYLADFIIDNSIAINTEIKAVFTTSELLLPNYRTSIEKAFNTKVFDAYGLNDGGVTTYECEKHNGMHIDTENAIMEVVDENGIPIENGVGRVIATSLYNFAMPFIRYDTGDYAEITTDTCTCGRQTKLIKRIIGRKVDILTKPDGSAIHGWFFLFIFWQHGEGFAQYQVVQETEKDIRIKYVKNQLFNKDVLTAITNIVKKNVPEWVVKFEEVEFIEKTKGGKQLFIINNLKK